MQKLWWIAVPWLAVTVGCTGPYSNAPVSAKEAAAVPVDALRLQTVAIPEVITANGELFAEELANVSTKVAGRVASLRVDLGSVLKAGDVLAELEKSDYEFRVQQSEAVVEQIRARLGIQAQKDDNVIPENTAMVREASAALKEGAFIFETTERLSKDGVVSRIEYEKANVRKQGLEARYSASLAEVMQLRSQLLERRAQLALARQQLEDTTIRAPFAGAITKRTANLGEFLAVNAPVVTLVRQNPLRVRLEVPERQASRVKSGMPIIIKMEGVEVNSTGRVVRLSPAIDAQSRTLLVEGEVPNADGKLRPGSFVEGTITTNAAAVGITVPFSAVMSFAGVERVFVIKNGMLEDRVLKTARRLANNQIEVLSGLKEGDQLVLKASDRMAKGQKVTVR